MKSAYWKGTEHATAKRTGGKRTSAPYRNAPDTVSPWAVTECKARKKLPKWIVNAVENARSHVEDPSRQIGVAVLHEKYKRHDNDLVVMLMKDFEDWFGGQVSSSEVPKQE